MLGVVGGRGGVGEVFHPHTGERLPVQDHHTCQSTIQYTCVRRFGRRGLSSKMHILFPL